MFEEISITTQFNGNYTKCNLEDYSKEKLWLSLLKM